MKLGNCRKLLFSDGDFCEIGKLSYRKKWGGGSVKISVRYKIVQALRIGKLSDFMSKLFVNFDISILLNEI